MKPRKLALAVSETLGVPVLLLEVYDSDSCEVALYNAGKLVSRFANEYEDRSGEPGNEAKVSVHDPTQRAERVVRS